MPFDLRFAALTTALGVQARPSGPHRARRYARPVQRPVGPERQSRVAGYMFNEFKFTDTLKAQLAGRIEHVDLKGTMPDFPADFLPDGSALVAIPRNLHFSPKSASFGVIKNLPWDLAASLTAQYVERAPKPAELFSRGPHDATATFDIGNPNLKIEVAKSIEVGLRRATGPFRFEATALLHAIQRLHLPPAHRRPVRRDVRHLRRPRRRAQPGRLFPARRDLPRRRVPERSSIFRRCRLEYGASKISSTWCVRPSPTAPMSRASRRCAWAAACSGAMPTGWSASTSCTPSRIRMNHADLHRDADSGIQQSFGPRSATRLTAATTWGPAEALSALPATTCSTTTSATVSFTKDEVLMPGRSVRVLRQREILRGCSR